MSLFTAGGSFFAGYLGDAVGHRDCRRDFHSRGPAGFLQSGRLVAGVFPRLYLAERSRWISLKVGVLCMIIPLYQAEPTTRGLVTALLQLMMGIGAVCASSRPPTTGNGAPRSPSNASLGLLIFRVPESPLVHRPTRDSRCWPNSTPTPTRRTRPRRGRGCSGARATPDGCRASS